MESVAADDPRNVDQVLSQLNRLPVLAPVAVRLLSATADLRGELREVCRLVASDAAIAAGVVAAARRADRGIVPELVTIDRAVALLGFRAIQCIVLTAHVIGLFKPPSGGRESGFDQKALWRHSLAVACAARALAARTGRTDGEEVFLAGLLHDLGKLALAACLPKSYDRVIGAARHRQADLLVVEREVLGTDHTVAGRRLAERWQLPRGLCECIWLHHLPPLALPTSLECVDWIRLVWLADVLVRAHRLGDSGNIASPLPVAQAAEMAAVSPEICDAVMRGLPRHIDECAAWIGLDVGDGAALYAEALALSARELSRAQEERGTLDDRIARLERYLSAVRDLHRAAGAGTSPAQACGLAAEAVRRAMNVPAAAAFRVAAGSSHPVIAVARASDPVGAREVTGGVVDAGPWMRRAAEYAARGIWVVPLPDDLRRLAQACGVENGAASWFFPALHDGRCIGGAVFGGAADEAAWLAEAGALETLSTAVGSILAATAAHFEMASLAEALAFSQRRLAEAQSELAEARGLRMTAELAAGAAHELNTPLAVISGRAQTLRQRAGDETQRVYAQEIVANAARASEVLSDLMEFAEPARPQPSAVDVAEIAASVLKSARERLNGVRQIDVQACNGLRAVWCDARQLAAALDELVRNAVDATDPGGQVTIKAALDRSDDSVVIEVADTGRGMEPAVLARAFDPFFSQRPAGRGRGMGLTRVRRWIEANGGTVSLHAAPGGGTLARIRLRAAAPKQPS